MEMALNEDWTADAVGCMHKYRISNAQLAAESGYTETYVSMVLNGRKAVGNPKTRETIQKALNRIVLRNEHDLEERDVYEGRMD